MSELGGFSRKAEIERLWKRLDLLTSQHDTELKSIRADLARLEEKSSFSKKENLEGDIKTLDRELPPAFPPTVPEKIQKEEPKLESVSERPIDEVPTTQKEKPSAGAFELDFGRVWFVRIGIMILLTGLVFLGSYAYQNWVRDMPNSLRLFGLFTCALGLVEAGRRIAKKENLNRFGEVLLAGGMAFSYYCTFAAYHVDRLKVIDSPVIAAILLFIAAAAMSAVSWIRQAKITAALGFILAAYATMLQPIGWMSCVSNITLGAAGLFFMAKPGWAGPGWVSMLGSYAAFIGWQIIGNFHVEASTLWFITPLWVIFTAPGLLGRFRESLSERSRAWFTGINNGLFFLLFSIAWINLYSKEGFEIVPAIFGTILILLGAIGRKQDTVAGSVHISQGLSAITFTLALKLEVQHLAMTLAFESLLLILASKKFRTKTEAVFSSLAGLGSILIIAENIVNPLIHSKIGIWSIVISAALLVTTSLVTFRMRKEKEQDWSNTLLRFSSCMFILGAIGMGSYLCLSPLEKMTGFITAIILSGLTSGAFIHFPSHRKQSEINFGALIFLACASFLACRLEVPWALGFAGLISLLTCWLWHAKGEDLIGKTDPDFSKLSCWAYSFTTPLFVLLIPLVMHRSATETFFFHELAFAILALVAVFLKCKRLVVLLAGFSVLSLVLLFSTETWNHWPLFGIVLLCIGTVLLLASPWARERISDNFSSTAISLFRLTGFILYPTAWIVAAPENWADGLAISVLGLTIFCVLLKQNIFLEAFGLLAISLIHLAFEIAISPWWLDDSLSSWRGAVTVLSLIAIAVTQKIHTTSFTKVFGSLVTVTLIVLTVWCTQMLIWRYGWKPTAVLWTALGFVYVSIGLWQRTHVLRISGLILLTLSLLKMFSVDIWDFTAFMRVVSFIFLGAALILLGLFYNKFSSTIRLILESEKRAIDE